jgi:hypothetical protein
MNHLIGVDIGTQSTKCPLVDLGGRVVAQASTAYQPDTPRPLWAQQDCAVWFDAVRHSVRDCVARRCGGRRHLGDVRKQPLWRSRYPYEKRFAIYTSLYPALRDAMHRLGTTA